MEKLSAIYEHTEDGWWVVSVPEIPGAHSQVPTQEGIQVCLAVERKDMDTAALAAWLYVRSSFNNPARPR